MAADTKDKLIQATLACLREDGFAAMSARIIATRAAVNQALIFYHFGSMPELVDAANTVAVQEATDHYRASFANATSLRELLSVGRVLQDDQAARGNVAIMAQLMAAGQNDPDYAAIAARSFDAWAGEVEVAVRRIIAGGVLADLADPSELARMICASFIGVTLYDGITPNGAADRFAALDDLVTLADTLDSLGPVARKALAATRRRQRKSATPGS